MLIDNRIMNLWSILMRNYTSEEDRIANAGLVMSELKRIERDIDTLVRQGGITREKGLEYLNCLDLLKKNAEEQIAKHSS